MVLSTKNVLGALSVKFDGNWEKLFAAIKNKEFLTDEQIENYTSKITTDYIFITSKDYPQHFLNELHCPPLVIYYKGDLSLLTERDKRKYIGIAGSRNISPYGQESVREIVKGLPKDCVIVSGLARGVDREAHEAALDNGMKTIAVLGNGIDYYYPRENAWLYKRIVDEGGLILSEYPSSSQPKPDQFVFRNRIVASISDFLLIAEAYERSGSSTTVNFALQCGKTVGCIPYPRGKNSLCNKLIKDGAVLVENATDITSELRR